MRMGNLELRHIVDVDGQLIGIDAEVVDAATLLGRAGLGSDRSVFVLRAGERIALSANQRIRLDVDEVLFFETAPASIVRAPSRAPFPIRLAA